MNFVKLVDLNKKDLPKIRTWIDPEIFRIFNTPVDDRQLEKLLTRKKKGIITDLGMSAIDPKSHKIIGIIHAVFNNQNNYCHIQQIVVDPGMRNRGWGSQILKEFLDICFDIYKFHRVQLFTQENNNPAICCYRKVGFHRDGLLRDINKTKDVYIGTLIFSIIENEWQKKKKQIKG